MLPVEVRISKTQEIKKYAEEFSDENGNFKLNWHEFDEKELTFVISAQDIDGQENGSFADSKTQITFSENEKTDATSWNDFYKINDKSLKLNKKE